MADDDQKLGLNAAMGDVTAEDVQAFKRSEQMSLIPTEAACQDIAEGDEAAERAGPGRPRGSKNKRTQEWTDFLLGRYQSPLVFLAETYSRPVQDVAKELNCKTEDAYRIQVAAAKELAPYVHQKQPVAVEVSQSGVVQLVLETSSDLADAVGAGQPGGDAVVIEGEIVDDLGVGEGDNEK